MNGKSVKSPRNQSNKPPASPPSSHTKFGSKARELADELIFVFVIVMFIKIFLVELYKIPSSSMTPTLLGGLAAEVDVNEDGRKDLFHYEPANDQRLVFLNDGKWRRLAPRVKPSSEQIEQWNREGKIRLVFDRILVNKLSYWFRDPRRGDVVVFKVPKPPFRIDAPIYIKRYVGEPGETLSFLPDSGDARFGQLVVNGEPVDSPEFFKVWRYRASVDPRVANCLDLPYVNYLPLPDGWLRLEQIKVPPGMAYVFGDNAEGSLDSRYWGGVPLHNFKGRAFMRVWPWRRIGFIH